MKKTVICFAVKFLQFINLFFRPLRLKEKVTIISRQSDEPTLDIRMLDECLKKNGMKTVVLTKTLNKSLSGAVSYVGHLMSQMYHIATSKVIVVDGYCILVSILPKKGQKVVQMWHALGAVKKFGWQNTENPDGHGKDMAEIMNMHGNYDYILAPGKITGRIFAEAFHTPEEKVIYYGLPRIDFIQDKDAAMIKRMEERYPQIKEKRNVLYVPTFRKNAELGLEKFINEFDFDSFNLIIKKHFLDKGNYIWAREKGAIVDSDFSSMEWLRISDKIITDYSAIAFEAAIIEKELYIYQPDASSYEHKVGLNVDLGEEEIGEYVCQKEEILFDKLKEDYKKEKVIAFRDKYLEIDLSNCTQSFCDFIAELLAE